MLRLFLLFSAAFTSIYCNPCLNLTASTNGSDWRECEMSPVVAPANLSFPSPIYSFSSLEQKELDLLIETKKAWLMSFELVNSSASKLEFKELLELTVVNGQAIIENNTSLERISFSPYLNQIELLRLRIANNPILQEIDFSSARVSTELEIENNQQLSVIKLNFSPNQCRGSLRKVFIRENPLLDNATLTTFSHLNITGGCFYPEDFLPKECKFDSELLLSQLDDCEIVRGDVIIKNVKSQTTTAQLKVIGGNVKIEETSISNVSFLNGTTVTGRFEVVSNKELCGREASEFGLKDNVIWDPCRNSLSYILYKSGMIALAVVFPLLAAIIILSLYLAWKKVKKASASHGLMIQTKSTSIIKTLLTGSSAPKTTIYMTKLWRRRRNRRQKRRRAENERLRSEFAHRRKKEPKKLKASQEEESQVKKEARINWRQSIYGTPQRVYLDDFGGEYEAFRRRQMKLWFMEKRMKRCARRAKARWNARQRAHSRAHMKKLEKKYGKMPRQKRPPKKSKPAEQRRLATKVKNELILGRHVRVRAPYWIEKCSRPRVDPRKTRNIFKVISHRFQDVYAPDKKRLSKFTKTLNAANEIVPDSDALSETPRITQMKKTVKSKNKDGVMFRWPMTKQVYIERFSSTFDTYDHIKRVGEWIESWSERGIFKLEERVRQQKECMGGFSYDICPRPQAGMDFNLAEHSRVKLSMVHNRWMRKRDYVNAAYFGTKDSPQRFICSSAPTDAWDYDYWSMLADHNVRCIVQLNNWDYLRERVNPVDYFIPFGRRRYIQPRGTMTRPLNLKRLKTVQGDKIKEYQEYRKRRKLKLNNNRKDPDRQRVRFKLSTKFKEANLRRENAGEEKNSQTAIDAAKLRRKRRRLERKEVETTDLPEIFVKKISVRYMNVPARKIYNPYLFRHSDGHLYWRIAEEGDDGQKKLIETFIVRVSLLRLVCRKENVNHRLVHFHVWNFDTYGQPDFAAYASLITAVNKISGTVSVVSERALSRGPSFCMAALLQRQLKRNQPMTDPLQLYGQMYLDRPYCMARPHGFFVALQVILEYLERYPERFVFKARQTHVKNLLEQVKVGLSTGRY